MKGQLYIVKIMAFVVMFMAWCCCWKNCFFFSIIYIFCCFPHTLNDNDDDDQLRFFTCAHISPPSQPWCRSNELKNCSIIISEMCLYSRVMWLRCWDGDNNSNTAHQRDEKCIVNAIPLCLYISTLESSSWLYYYFFFVLHLHLFCMMMMMVLGALLQ